MERTEGQLGWRMFSADRADEQRSTHRTPSNSVRWWIGGKGKGPEPARDQSVVRGLLPASPARLPELSLNLHLHKRRASPPFDATTSDILLGADPMSFEIRYTKSTSAGSRQSAAGHDIEASSRGG